MMNTEQIKSLLDKAVEAENNGQLEIASTLIQDLLKRMESIFIEEPLQSMAMDEKEGYVKLWSNALFLSVVVSFKSNKRDDAMHQVERVMQLSKDNHFKDLEAKCYNMLGNLFRFKDSNKAIDYYKQALQLFYELNDAAGAAKVASNIGMLYHDTANYAGAIEFLERAQNENESMGNENEMAIINSNIGTVYLSLSDYSKSLVYLSKALSIHERTGNKAEALKVLSNTGIVYASLGDYNQALYYFNKVLEEYMHMGNMLAAADVIGNLGQIYLLQRDNKQAIDYLQQALEIFRTNNMKHSEAVVMGNLGSVYMALSDFDNAINWLQKSLDCIDPLQFKKEYYRTQISVAKIYIHKDYKGYNPVLAEELLHQLIHAFKDIGVKNEWAETCKVLSDLYADQKRWEESYEKYKEYHLLTNELLNEESMRQAQLMEQRRKIEESEKDRQVKLARFQEQEKILLNILPEQIAERMLQGEKQIADSCAGVSVFFCDIVGFTKLSQQITAQELVSMLNEIFTAFDSIALKHGLEKIKTIGDAYMAAAGVPNATPDHPQKAANFALEVLDFMEGYRSKTGKELQIRVGLHCGQAVAGIIGQYKFAYDLWGDAVNTASRMESHGEPGRIQVSDDFRKALADSAFSFEERGEIEIKGKGKMKTYFLEKES